MFSALKSACMRPFDLHCADYPAADLEKTCPVQFLMEVRERASVDVLRRAQQAYAERPQTSDEDWDEVRLSKRDHDSQFIIPFVPGK
jgi:hypothetical protein